MASVYNSLGLCEKTLMITKKILGQNHAHVITILLHWLGEDNQAKELHEKYFC